MPINTLTAPHIEQDAQDGSRIHLSGSWVLANILAAAELLQLHTNTIRHINARNIDHLDSAGVLQLLRFAAHTGLKNEAIEFREEHRTLISTIEILDDEHPRSQRDYGFLAALERLGIAVTKIGHNIVDVCSFLGENLLKIVQLAREPRRFRLTSTVHHMEQVGLDAVPLVVVLSYLVGAVIAFLGSTILRNFGAEIFVVELVNIAFLREFAVLLTAIVLAGRTASAFTAQIGAMKSREEIDAIQTLGLDPIDLLVIPRLVALLVMLPLLTFIAMIAGLAGGITVGAFDLGIPPQMYLSRMHETMQVRHFLIGLSKAPLFALIIGLIGCLEGLKVTGTAQSVGKHTTSSVVQTISLVIIIDALAALWFMRMGW
ncbi:ABC transporter permease [Xylella taiwanensis]|uniref:ABC transporter permease n=1 Tax=Xylella taiwanensis TaxID=1444770 RepID=Z9JJY2_9GAMM|nr:ABC transporter permease [Xylella taiwanensis]AXI83092.1 ABC transporter permease [Xylella taiwanensis]EWS78730.1 ABC transporter permease [Xylella taiwanensis]MCD8456126.1 ABC transporter permease [Xylella taiwanensis]MCD8458531.1 ABC transporter permease [Xylella taiwanensis]MCD8460666.1 ABC transporter permease [Xylella taiwanensis]